MMVNIIQKTLCQTIRLCAETLIVARFLLGGEVWFFGASTVCIYIPSTVFFDEKGRKIRVAARI